MKRIGWMLLLPLMATLVVVGPPEARSIPAQVTGKVAVYLFDANRQNVDRLVVIDGQESRRHTGNKFQLSQGSHRITLSGAQDYEPKFNDIEIISEDQNETVVFTLDTSSHSERTDIILPPDLVLPVRPSN